jgi:hypothetical protein
MLPVKHAIKILEPKDTYLLPFGEKQSANSSSSAFLRTWKPGERETRQIHLSAKEFAGIW